MGSEEEEKEEDPYAHYQMFGSVGRHDHWTVADHLAEDQRSGAIHHYDPASTVPEMKTSNIIPSNNNNNNQEWPTLNNTNIINGGRFCGLIQDIIGSNYRNSNHNGRNNVDSIDQGGVTSIRQGAIRQLDTNDRAELMVIDALDQDYQYQEASMNASWMMTNSSVHHSILPPFSDNTEQFNNPHGLYKPLPSHPAG